MQDFEPRKNLPSRLHRIIDPWVAGTPDSPALQDASGTLTYAELGSAIAESADRLRQAGLRPGDRFLVVAENCNAAAVLAFAASAVDAWVSIVNARLSAREIDTFRIHSGARLVAFLSTVSKEAAEHGRRLGAQAVEWPGAGRFHLTGANEHAIAEPVFESSAEQVAALIYTSGTSGDPKGVMLTHRNLLFIAENGRCMRHLTPADRVYGVLPISHVYGLTAVLLATLHAGASLLLESRFDATRVAHALAREGVTVLHGVPAMYAKLLEWGRRPGNALAAPTLRIVQSGGAPLDQALKDEVERTLGRVLQNGYGMTEAAPSISQTRLDKPRADCSVGQPIPGIEARIVDRETGADAGAGNVGELRVRGPNVMKGYFRNPEQTAETVDRDGWLSTGDLARQDADGALFIVGRSKELIIRSGFNVYPVEVEQALNSHPDVVHSAVVGRAVEGNEEVVAFVEAVPGSGLSLDALAAFLRDRLSPYKLPAEIVMLEHLPATATGKILKNQLRQMAAARRES